jgi:hypothetical protein
MLKTVKQIQQGAQILNQWLGAGGEPVDGDLAEERADVCRDCPENVRGNWLDRIKGEAASVIKDYLAVKAAQGLEVPDERDIGFCKQCGCALQLKVWCPIEHIKAHMTRSEMLEFPTFCWIRKEITKA